MPWGSGTLFEIIVILFHLNLLSQEPDDIGPWMVYRMLTGPHPHVHESMQRSFEKYAGRNVGEKKNISKNKAHGK